MWESVEKLVSSGKGWFVLIIIGLIIFATRQGYMKVKTEKILIGRDSGEKERLLMMKQTEYAETACEAFEKRIPRFNGYDESLGKLISMKAYAEIIRWVMINHIEDNFDYITNKQEIIWNIVSTEVTNDKFRTDKFKAQVYDCIEQIIKRLVQIRENNS